MSLATVDAATPEGVILRRILLEDVALLRIAALITSILSHWLSLKVTPYHHPIVISPSFHSYPITTVDMTRKLCFALHTALLVFTFVQLAASEVVDHKKAAPLQKRADCRFETAEDDTLTTYGEQVRISPEIACRGSDCQLTRSTTYTLPNTNTFGIPSDTDVDLFGIVSANISFRSVNVGTVGHTVQETLSQKVLAGTMGFVSLKPKYECELLS